MIDLNLLPPVPKQQVRDRAYLIIVKNTVFIMIVLLLINTVAVVGLKFYLDFRTSTIEKEIATLRATRSNTQSLDEATVLVNNKISYLQKIQTNYVYWSDRLLDMTQEMPSGITMTSISLDNEALILSLAGEAATRDDLLVYKEQLVSLPFLVDINLPITNLTTQTDIIFQITATIFNDVS